MTDASAINTQITTVNRWLTSIRIWGVLCGSVLIGVFPGLLKTPFLDSSLVGCFILMLAAVYQKSLPGKGSSNRVGSDLMDIASWFPAACLISALILIVLVPLSPQTIDSALDFGVGRYMMHWSLRHPLVDMFFSFVYGVLPIAMAAAMVSSGEPRRIVRALVVAAVLAVPLYVAFPAVGPIGGKSHQGLRNCMPSLHLAWALMLAYYSGRRLRLAMIIFAALTAIATLTTGQHYLLDLIAAIPFSIVCIWVSSPAPENNQLIQPPA